MIFLIDQISQTKRIKMVKLQRINGKEFMISLIFFFMILKIINMEKYLIFNFKKRKVKFNKIHIKVKFSI